MAKALKSDRVSVLLTCSYSGHPQGPGPGGIIELPAEEAAHIVAAGGGTIVDAKAQESTED